MNGYLSSSASAFPAIYRFPARHHLLSLICPFYANVDTTSSGAVYYRRTSGSAAIDNEIRRYFSSAASFTASWVLIATWYNVGYYNNHADKVQYFKV